MATTLRVDVVVTVDGRPYSIRSYDSDGEPGQSKLSIAGEVHSLSTDVPALGKALLWNQAVDPVTDFDFCGLVSVGGDCEVSFTAVDGGNEVNFVLTLRDGFPILIPSDVTRDSNHTADWGVDGAAGELDKIEVKNFSTTVAIRVEGFIAG